MNKIVGITGYMASGKSFILKKLTSLLGNECITVDVDIFRRNLLKENNKYINELKIAIPDLKKYSALDSLTLNKYIYSNKEYMDNYKEILYKYLFEYINTLNYNIIFIEWSLIIKDNLFEKFNKIIYVESSLNNRFKRLENADLNKEEIIKRFQMQLVDNPYEILRKHNINYIVVNNDKDIDYFEIIDFIGR